MGLGADRTGVSEALFVLLGLADRRAEAPPAHDDGVIREIVQLRRKGFRFIALADDNFYPVLTDLKIADRQDNTARSSR